MITSFHASHAGHSNSVPGLSLGVAGRLKIQGPVHADRLHLHENHQFFSNGKIVR
ncbi:MAG TPA: hypothetical protein VGC95_10790 [Chitinophagaceae bacterium]